METILMQFIYMGLQYIAVFDILFFYFKKIFVKNTFVCKYRVDDNN